MKEFRITDSQIIAVLRQASAGTRFPELCRTHGISSATFYKWRSKFGGMDASLMSQLKELQDENRRLKKMYPDALILPCSSLNLFDNSERANPPWSRCLHCCFRYSGRLRSIVAGNQLVRNRGIWGFRVLRDDGSGELS